MSVFCRIEVTFSEPKYGFAYQKKRFDNVLPKFHDVLLPIVGEFRGEIREGVYPYRTPRQDEIGEQHDAKLFLEFRFDVDIETATHLNPMFYHLTSLLNLKHQNLNVKYRFWVDASQ